MKTFRLHSMVAMSVASLSLVVFPSSAWHLSYSQVDAAGYAYFGHTWPDGLFETNLVAIPANTTTNLNMSFFFVGGHSSNEFRFELRSNSLAAHHAFDLDTGGWGFGVGRGGLLLRGIVFTLVPDLTDPANGAVPLRLTLRSTPALNRFHASAEVRTSICEWNNDRPGCSNVMEAAVTSSDLAGPGSLTNHFTLELGRSYKLTCLLAAGAGGYAGSEIPGWHNGTNSFTLEPIPSVNISVDNTQARLCIQGWPGRRYAVERSGDLSTWTPITTNSAPAGTFEYLDEDTPGATSRFYRAVEQP